MNAVNIEYTQWLLKRLKPHPWQKEVWGRRSDGELQELASLINTSGMDAIDVAPNGIVLNGHQRLIIAKKYLKWADVPVKIRHDLAAQGPAALDRFFLHMNLSGRVLNKLQLAQVWKHAMELEQQFASQDPNNQAEGRLRDIVGARYGVKGRTMHNWVQLLDASHTVQHAVLSKELPLADGLRIARATEEEKAAVEARIAEGGGILEAVRDVLPPDKPLRQTRSKYCAEWDDLLRSVRIMSAKTPDSLCSLLPKHRRGLKALVQLADSVRDMISAMPLPENATEADYLDEELERELPQDASEQDEESVEMPDPSPASPPPVPRPVPRPLPRPQAAHLPPPMPKPIPRPRPVVRQA